MINSQKTNVAMMSKTQPTSSTSRFVRLALVASCGLLLVACEAKNEVRGSLPDDYRKRHPIILQQSAKTIDIPVGIHSEKLTPASKSALTGYARNFLQERAAVIQVMIPSGGDNESNAGYMAKEVRAHLMRSGVSATRIDLIPYTANASSDAPIRLAYPRVEPKTLPCGSHPGNMAFNPGNRQHFDFGCTTQQNFAAMVANPQDLIQPRGWDPRDSNRRSKVTEKYRTGEATWSQDLGNSIGSSSEVKQ